MCKRYKAVTLLELIIALILVGIIGLALSNIEIFSRTQVVSGDRRAKIQNEASRALEFIGKQLNRTTGNEISSAANNTVVYTVELNPPTGDNDSNRLNFFVDLETGTGGNDGKGDIWRGFRYHNAGANSHQIVYCDQCSNNTCDTCTGTQEVIATNIAGFYPQKPVDVNGKLNDNSIPVSIRACADATGGIGALDTLQNPCVTMNARIQMPSVSTN